jgi:hypothetical protein
MGGDSGTIIVRNLKAAGALSVGGKWKVWQVFVVTHVIAFIAGALIF